MNPSAIYSKSGKGVQEASGKTSLLKRADRAVLSAIDGRATLGEVAQKVGKPFDGAFQALISQLDKDGFVREVSGAAAPAARPAAKPAAAPPRPVKPAPAGAGEDLDFTGIMASPLKAPPKPAAAQKPAFDPSTTQRLQEEALYKARQEAEARAQEQRDRLRAEAEAKARSEAEAKVRAETEKRLRAEAEAKAKAEAEAKARAAREAAARLAAEAKAKIEAEAKAKIEAERRAREEAERKAREEAEKARREAEELRQRLEEERRAREEAERKAREEAERKEAERRAREEAERKAREEAERREAERKAREEAERRAREEAERRAREDAERKARAEAEAKARAEQEAQMHRAREEAERKRAEAERREAEKRKSEPLPELTPPPPAPDARPAAGGGLDALMADLDSFTQRDEEDRKSREQAESQAKEDRKRKLREETEQREREQAERERQEAEDRRRQEELRREEERRAREAEEQRAREEAERQREEAEERERMARQAVAAQAAGSDDIGVTDDDLGMDDVRRDEKAVAKESRKARREREREQKRLEKEARERARDAARNAARAKAKDEPIEVKAVTRVRRRRNWGRPVAIGLFLLLAAGLGALHVMPVPTEEYQRAASAALGQPVRIGAARLSLFTGVRLNLTDVAIGSSTRIASARAYPELGSLLGDTKAFKRIELDGVALRQDSLGESLFARAGGRDFAVERIVIKDLKLEGPLPVPLLEADVRLAGDGSVRTVDLRGPEGLLGQVTPRSGAVDFDVTAATFTLPFAPEVSMTSFAMKGRATRLGMKIDAWGGSVLGGALSGTANLRWGGTWQLDGVLTARGINAAVFAPALLSEGFAEGSGKFSMSGAEPSKLARAGRVEGSFTIGKGVLGSFDLTRAIRTDGREFNGRTQFVELNGQGTYDRGAVALRNVVIGAGALQAGASADISQSGALSGRIVADVRTASQSLRTTLLLGGTVQEPQVRN